MREAAPGKNPAVTVLMAVRDGAPYLRAAVQSILDQTFEDFEFLVVDDASVDATGTVIHSYDDPRIRLVRNAEHEGLTRSLVRGLEMARGRYLARMDADDLSAPERLERQLAYLEAHPECALVATFARKIDACGAEVGEARSPLGAGALRRELRRGNCITHGSVMMRADSLQLVGGYDPSMTRSQDYDLWLRLSEQFDLATLPEYLYAWREHEGSISGRHTEEQDEFAARARRAALKRRVGALLSRLGAAGAPPHVGVRRVVELMREEADLRSLSTRGGVLARWWLRRVVLRARWFALRNHRAVGAVGAALNAHAVGEVDAGETVEALVAQIEAVTA